MDKTDKLRAFVESFRDRYANYHDQKEKMAYASFAAFAAAFGTGIVSVHWPPWCAVTPPVLRFILAFGAATSAWVATLWFIGWQLLRRRLAAVRVAAAERLLLRWITTDPKDSDFSPAPASQTADWKLRHLLYPPNAPLPEADVEEARFPITLVREWRSQTASLGTQAKKHERALVVAGWILWLVLVIKTAVVIFI
jgi:hypothetical protein